MSKFEGRRSGNIEDRRTGATGRQLQSLDQRLGQIFDLPSEDDNYAPRPGAQPYDFRAQKRAIEASPRQYRPQDLRRRDASRVSETVRDLPYNTDALNIDPQPFADTSKAMAGPKRGEVVDGYEFLGGDPSDKRSWQSWGPGARALPDGSIVRDGPRGGVMFLRKAEQGQGGEPLREFEINAAARATLMDEGQREYQRAKADGYNPGDWRNVVARTIEDAPIPGGNYLSDVIRDKPSERARAAELQFVDGALRTTSGANAPEPEQIRANRAYFRQPGESAGVEPNKTLIRDRFRSTSISAAGRAYKPRTDAQQAGASYKKPPIPAAALAAQARMRAAINTKAPFGTERNPYIARDDDTLKRLPKGSYAIAPNGDFGVVE